MKILLTPTEKKIIENLNDPLYTIDFLDEWINRTDTIAFAWKRRIQQITQKHTLRSMTIEQILM